MEFCLYQERPDLLLQNTGRGQFKSLGKIPLADAAAKTLVGTFVEGGYGERFGALRAGEAIQADLADPYCAAVLRIEEIR